MRPQTESDLAEIIRSSTTPLAVRGGGTRAPVTAEAVLETGGLSGITLYEPGALTLVAAAGTPLAEIEDALAAEGQRLAFEPGDWRGLLGRTGQSTIGGVVAANVSGPRRVQAGAARDFLLGVRFVDGSGSVIRNGGRVMKNVTGYDLVKLMAGSRGTLGVITEVALKVLPVPAAVATLCVAVPDAAGAVAALSAALGSPYDVTGAAWLPGQGALLRIEGFSDSVRYRAGRLEPLLARFGAVERLEGDALWAGLRDGSPFAERQGDVWRFSVKPSDAPEIAARLGRDVFLDWGGGLIWALLPEGTDARALAAPYTGHATLIRAGAATRVRLPETEPEPPAIAALTDGIRARFDPRGIFRPVLA